ncbi:hypothetical protein QBC46DRAFT_354467 [Diplogelasinospora grovesii]|uniref:DH domain-containing protein n=1 Tax=Diplogelasinospora grovesii TaxID=303347 RepID=A0AAN6N6K8_9PEZI|nr:hypothetical protein QBC46DRAFT_354467 [Diplogelasinospora grovesii]
MALVVTHSASPCSYSPSDGTLTLRGGSGDIPHLIVPDEHVPRSVEETDANEVAVDHTSNVDDLHMHGANALKSLDETPAGQFRDSVSLEQQSKNTEYFSDEGEDFEHTANGAAPSSSTPFYKWIRTIQKRAARRREVMGSEGDVALCYVSADGDSSVSWRSSHRRQSSSGSSFGFVTAVKSASISLTSASVLTRSRRNALRSSLARSKTDRSSRASVEGARLSEDSTCLDRQMITDPLVMERSQRRRRILEELIHTEESYIGDVRLLMHVYITIFAAMTTTLPPGVRSSINQNLSEIVELHEEMLGDLHRAVPYSEYNQFEEPGQEVQSTPAPRGHHRWRSLDAVPEDKDRMSLLRDSPGVALAEPQTAAEVAKIFSKKMNRFFIYEEYGAKYELMMKDMTTAQKTIVGWQAYQKGLEVLSAALSSVKSRGDYSKKSSGFGDLAVKPIQRVCKYPLLFAELLKSTPVVDCPLSHMEIENTLVRLREATSEINRATDDARIKTTMEKTWILQDRLVFPDQQLDAASRNIIRSFGHVQLCGALHVCWQTEEGVSGQYMVSLLYREWLCLARASRIDQIYTIQACIPLSNIKVEEVDNGRGLQCHTAPYSWKLVFLCDHQLYEMILTACTPKEELEWRTRLSSAPNAESQDQMQSAIFSSLSLNIVTLGTVFGKPGTIARRISIHRATTIGPKSPLYQVILKNTSVIKDAPKPVARTPINRSQSTTNHRIPVIAPPRGDRARLEALLSDVWTRDILPFPGITTRSRSENLVRGTASSMMRKLSVSSIASSFSKRSASLASLQRREEKAGAEEDAPHGSDRAKDGVVTPMVPRNLSDDASRSFLSVIPDEAEQSSPPVCAGETGWGAEVLRMARQLDRSGTSTTESKSEDVRSCRGALRQTSTNNSRAPSRQNSVRTRVSAYESDKENINMSGTMELYKASTHAHKLSAKLARAGVRRREAVVQGIRSLFR